MHHHELRSSVNVTGYQGTASVYYIKIEWTEFHLCCRNSLSPKASSLSPYFTLNNDINTSAQLK